MKMFKRWINRKRHTSISGAPGLPIRDRKTMEPSVVSANMNVLGNIISDGVLDIDGQIDGNVRAEVVTLRPNGRIRGDLMAAEVYVHGTVDGLIKAQAVNLFATAIVRGIVMHESLTVEDGAVVDGKLKRTEPVVSIEDHREEAVQPRVGAPAIDSSFVNDNDDPQSDAELKILENLRLIS